MSEHDAEDHGQGDGRTPTASRLSEPPVDVKTLHAKIGELG
jgi:hypothetical protein